MKLWTETPEFALAHWQLDVDPDGTANLALVRAGDVRLLDVSDITLPSLLELQAEVDAAVVMLLEGGRCGACEDQAGSGPCVDCLERTVTR